ncbi:MAG: lipoprotein signal peptidase [Actinomycetia bacterium]|nr:lipoprotein signal peptidase [Actinomycetes bacterium]
MPNDAADAPGTVDPSAPSGSRPVLAATIVVAVLALDQASKVWAVDRLSDGHRVEVIDGQLWLALSRNTGSAFSLFSSFTPILAVIAIGVAVFLVRVVRRARDPLLVVALSLVLAGAVGNLIDRVFRSPGFMKGAVIDFIASKHWPTFNVADSAITIGALVLLVWGWRRPTHPARPATTSRSRGAGPGTSESSP